MTPAAPTPAPRPTRRSPGKAAVMLLRRFHLYFGLLLFPWAVLYGVTAFLFNHPTAFADQPVTTFPAAAVAGTPLADAPTADQTAAAVVAKLNETQSPATPYVLAGPAKYAREFAFATAKDGDKSLALLFDVKNGGGTIRVTADKPKKESPKAPFAVSGPRGDKPSQPAGPGLTLDNPLHDRVKAAAGVALANAGFTATDIVVTSVPDVVFPLAAGGETWTASYNAATGAVTGKVPGEGEQELTVRRFLLRLHLAHGYPGEANARWFWAVVADAMAFVMLFWGVSGLFMWWQIKSTRKIGLVLLAASATAAVALGVAMHAALSG